MGFLCITEQLDTHLPLADRFKYIRSCCSCWCKAGAITESVVSIAAESMVLTITQSPSPYWEVWCVRGSLCTKCKVATPVNSRPLHFMPSVPYQSRLVVE